MGLQKKIQENPDSLHHNTPQTEISFQQATEEYQHYSEYQYHSENVQYNGFYQDQAVSQSTPNLSDSGYDTSGMCSDDQLSLCLPSTASKWSKSFTNSSATSINETFFYQTLHLH